MNTILLAFVGLLMLSGPVLGAEECSEGAKDMALHLYEHNASTIQGSDPKASVKVHSRLGKTTTYLVTLEDGNDEGETWTVKYSVRTKNSRCRIKSIREN